MRISAGPTATTASTRATATAGTIDVNGVGAVGIWAVGIWAVDAAAPTPDGIQGIETPVLRTLEATAPVV